MFVTQGLPNESTNHKVFLTRDIVADSEMVELFTSAMMGMDSIHLTTHEGSHVLDTHRTVKIAACFEMKHDGRFGWKVYDTAIYARDVESDHTYHNLGSHVGQGLWLHIHQTYSQSVLALPPTQLVEQTSKLTRMTERVEKQYKESTQISDVELDSDIGGHAYMRRMMLHNEVERHRTQKALLRFRFDNTHPACALTML